MARIRPLKKAPICEALIDIRVTLAPGFDVSELEGIHNQIKADYPIKEDRVSVGVQIDFEKGFPTKALGGKDRQGFWFRSADRTRLFQARVNGFTFNRLPLYDSWEATRNEARRLWDLYVKVAKPVSITRVAVRYINDLEFPMTTPDPAQFLTAPPPVPPNLSQTIGSFLTRVLLHDAESGASALLTQVMEGGIHADTWPVTLDIDVFREGTFPLDGKEAWEVIEQLRTLKNRVFFESLTEKALEPYE